MIDDKRADELGALVWQLLKAPHTLSWTMQGLGMLRTVVGPSERFRVNIWHHDLLVPGVSRIHDHPWDFESLVLAGEMRNYKMEPCVKGAGSCYDFKCIRCGPGGGPTGNGGVGFWLAEMPVRTYGPGESYRQEAKEVHFTDFVDGTVTINDRREVSHGHSARVFYPHGSEWVDAKPRHVEAEAVPYIISLAIGRLRSRLVG